MTKKKEEEGFLKLDENPTVEAVLYDAEANQTVTIEIKDGTDIFRQSHEYNPMSDARYFAFESELEEIARKAKNFRMNFYEPKVKLGKDLIVSADYDFEDETNFRDDIDDMHYVQAVNAMLTFEVLPAEEKKAKFSPKSNVTIRGKAYQNGALIDVALIFRRQTSEERNRFLIIEANEPDDTQLASAVKKPKAQKLCELGRGLLVNSEGFAGDVPAHILSKATESFFIGQLANSVK